MSDHTILTPEEALKELQSLSPRGDPEGQHVYADEVLCCLLRFYNQHEVVAAFDALKKWYA